ncbi:MAG: ATP-binding protein [Candidatus Delongbacteria bacterium]
MDRVDMPLKVLLIEKNEDHGILINSVFIRYGSRYKLTIVRRIDKALEFAESSDIIISNLYLDDGSPLDLLKNSYIYKNVPVVVLESYVDQETVVTLIKSGVLDYINKSADMFESLPEKIDKFIELSDLRKDRNNIADRQNKLSTAIYHSSETIVITDIKGIIEFVNPAFEKTTGYSAGEVLGRSTSILKSGQHDKVFYEDLWKTILAGKPWKGHFINKKKNGDIYEEDASISPVFDESGNIINFVALKRDISDMIRIENQLRHAQKMEGIGTLAAGIAHEINTPLQYISDNTLFIKDSFKKISDFYSNVRKLSENCSENEVTYRENCLSAITETLKDTNLDYLMNEIPGALEESMNGIQIVRKIVMAMKTFSHPGLKTMQKADINDAITSTVTITKNVWKYVAEVETYPAENLPEITCHIGDINQVILNMITNSCDAIAEKKTEEKGLIKISTSFDKAFIYITIEDNGAGVPTGLKEKIFQPFFTTKQIGKGTGQGLALSYDIIVNKHNGGIKVDSEHGKGTIFTIKLPIENNV